MQMGSLNKSTFISVSKCFWISFW